MALDFKVVRILEDHHWDAFHVLLERRQTTVDSAHAWMVARGYPISRSAVGRYMEQQRPALTSRRNPTGDTDKLIATLTSDQLKALWAFARLLASGQRIVVSGDGSTGV